MRCDAENVSFEPRVINTAARINVRFGGSFKQNFEISA